MITMNVNKVLNDFKWVIKILESSESKAHMDTTLKCFALWENKYVDDSLSKSDKQIITELRSRFWSKFKNKFTNIGTINV